MTRENKLALVVGFGLILFVGILISDHFSVARHQASADLGNINDPLNAHRMMEADLVDLRPPSIPPAPPPVQRQMAANTATIVMGGSNRDGLVAETRSDAPGSAETAQANAQQSSSANISLPGFERVEESVTLVTLAELAQQAGITLHEVRSGDSLFSICRQHFGDTSLVKALAKFNGLDDPNSLRAGMHLRIPAATELGGAPPAKPTTVPKPASTPNAAAAKPAKTYVVKAGDNLSMIAQRTLGDRNKWRQIYEMNRNVIDEEGGPDNLRVGTVLRVNS